MGIELLVVPDCPRQAAAVDLLDVALAGVGLPAAFSVVTVADVDDATRRRFIGSPTFQADGMDLFPQHRLGVGGWSSRSIVRLRSRALR